MESNERTTMRTARRLTGGSIVWLILASCGGATSIPGAGDHLEGDAVRGGDAGPCGIDCDLATANGTGICDTSDVPARCVVDTCEPGFIQLSDTVCAPPPDVSCKPCADDDDCYGGTCTILDGVSACVGLCTGTVCPSGYECQDIGGGLDRCVPTSGACACNATTDGQTRACQINNGFGTCFGLQTCGATTGWASCAAATPAAEDCDGIDDDCDGFIDNGVTEPGAACEITNGFGTCTENWVCSGGSGWTCAAMTPAVETCDSADNDCDSSIDEDLKDVNGNYVHDDHCGACSVTCTGAIPDASSTCNENGSSPRCEVDQCVLGYEQVGPLTCLAAAGQLCSDCVNSAECAVAGDECLPSVEGDHCAQDCSAGNTRGTPPGQCPTGFTCTDLGGGVEQCTPDSGVCSCQAINHSETRECTVSNGFGTCTGLETCDSVSGWDACTAAVPEAEDCDGVDNDCNVLIDDALPPGAACTVDNAYGSCAGTESCAGSSGWVCNAAVPEAETCDYQDNNCDSQTDEGFANLFQGCGAGTGICERFGFYACTSDGSGTECNATAGTPDTEVCDDLDNDCMGDVDEDAAWSDKGTACVVGTGACEAAGIRICNPGDPAGPTICSATAGSGGPETCNGIDDDCDSTPDNNLTDTQTCTEQEGVCNGSVRRCAGAAGYLSCTTVDFGPDYESVEVTCDGKDNDCDNTADDGLFAPPCALQSGVCWGSTQACGGAVGWQSCDAGDYGSDYEATESTCDGLDNDCNGTTDDGHATGGSCVAGIGGCQQTGTIVCNVAGDGVECSVSGGASGPETCNGIDDDCDGTPDNNFASVPPCAEQDGVCAGSTQRCGGAAGWLACTGVDYGASWEPVEISCDGDDNDCDGFADNNLPAFPCAVQDGVCAGSTTPCNGSSCWGACGSAPTTPTPRAATVSPTVP